MGNSKIIKSINNKQTFDLPQLVFAGKPILPRAYFQEVCKKDKLKNDTKIIRN